MEPRKENILFVHDDDELYEYVVKHLREDGHRIIRVSDGEEATMSLLSDDVSVVITDAKADKINSVDLLEIVGAKDGDVPVIILADDGTMEVVAQAMKKGAFDYLKMPFDGYDLVSTVKKAFNFRMERIERAEEKSEKRREDAARQSQNEIRSLLTNIIPTILLPSPQPVKTRFIKEMCDNIEQLFCDKYISKTEEVDSVRAAEVIQLVFNQLGGDFKTIESSSGKIVIEGKTCPWGDQAKKNPVLCMLTRAIASRVAVRCRSCAMVILEKTIGNGDKSCIIKIENL
ncbi:MAG: methanogen output domain 1-containing protein [Thermoplasmata archaeon]|nr:methanogen output domain 1-containing protein [Thermoplasmata archaeon]